MHVRSSLLCPLLLLCAVSLVSCKKPEPSASAPASPPPPQAPSQPSQPASGAATPAPAAALATGVNALAVELYRAGQPPGENFVFSPASISTAFSMLYAGAQQETAQELQRVFHFSLQGRELLEAHGALLASRSDKCELESANSLWLNQGLKLKQDFAQLASTSARAAFEQAHFEKEPEQARGRINQWISTQTRGHIPDLIPEGGITADTRLVLANALYFKGRWSERFEKAATQPTPFRLLSGKAAEVPMMQRTGHYRMARLDSVRLLELDYECSDMALLILLPETGEPAEEGAQPAGKVLTPAEALERLEKELSAQALAQWTSGLGEKQQVLVSLPRFTLKRELPLTKTLKALGLQRAYSSTAQFQGITEDMSLALSDSFHQSFVKVDEEGTEAAAATSDVVTITSAPPPPPRFTVDRPFLFALRHKGSGALLFLGRVVDPR